ncbi:hypothetical protein HER10_EVM0002534 [Colletotrichum scovillei]|uniref:uncharacterized protein n=1 Tax=Colletotrichum scovillei TaxID=1209932 RepID=UPI0015C3966E|nr:uncharacterized protein HER10_EVM0002534 [Colletotrichum scovillei]KAF4785094.1 hypothetical protein HER10_EVM0002534 [Colletotrichum scovillei]
MELDEESAILSLAPFKELKYLLLYGTGLLNPYSATYYPSGVRLHSVLQSILPESIVSVASNDLKYTDILNLSTELRNGEYAYLRRLWIPNWLNIKISAAREGSRIVAQVDRWRTSTQFTASQDMGRHY